MTSAAQTDLLHTNGNNNRPKGHPTSYHRRRHRYHPSRLLLGPGASTSHGLLPQRRPRLLPPRLAPEPPASE